MGTKSNIAIERTNGAVDVIQCQYDGYPSYIGAMLLNHYNTPDLPAQRSIIVPRFIALPAGESGFGRTESYRPQAPLVSQSAHQGKAAEPHQKHSPRKKGCIRHEIRDKT